MDLSGRPMWAGGTPMNWFVIAPDHDNLPNASAEIAAIARHHNAQIIRGLVRDEDIAARLDHLDDAGFVVEVICWITHGGPEGVQLSDGLLDIAGAGQYVRKSAAHLCIFNTCSSEEIALSIIATASETDMIYTVGDVRNRDAVRFGILLAPALAQHESYHAAYDAVAPDGGPYRYLEARAQYRRHEYKAVEEIRAIDRVALADRTQIKQMLIVASIVIFAAIAFGFGVIHRELVTLEQNQMRILDDVHEVEQRIIQLQLSHDVPYTYPPFDQR